MRDDRPGVLRARRVLLSSFFALATVVACSASREDDPRERTGTTKSALTTRIPASADTYLKQGTPNQNQGTLTTLRLQQSGKNRALVRMPQADVANLTAGTSVSLELTIVGQDPSLVDARRWARPVLS